jgi:hypothetical protein
VELHRDVEVQQGLLIDAALPLTALTIDLADALRQLAPFGQGNPTPQFVTYGLQVTADQRMGARGPTSPADGGGGGAGKTGAATAGGLVWRRRRRTAARPAGHRLHAQRQRVSRRAYAAVDVRGCAPCSRSGGHADPRRAADRARFARRGRRSGTASPRRRLPTWYAEGGRLEQSSPRRALRTAHGRHPGAGASAGALERAALAGAAALAGDDECRVRDLPGGPTRPRRRLARGAAPGGRDVQIRAGVATAPSTSGAWPRGSASPKR